MQLYVGESNLFSFYPCLPDRDFSKNCSSYVNPIIIIPEASSLLLSVPTVPAVCVSLFMSFY